VSDVPADLAAPAHPDYELDDHVLASGRTAMRALADPLRLAILDLVLERAASVTELAAALGRPRGTVGHHVKVLEDVGLLKVVRTRQVRAVTERFYGRTGRTIDIAGSAEAPAKHDMLAQAMREVEGRPDDRFTLRHARIAEEHAEAFFARVVDLAVEFTKLPRSGDVVFGFLAGIYETDLPTLPERREGAEP
jgi:DNA-binding transcriptional ArsR family regulator